MSEKPNVENVRQAVHDTLQRYLEVRQQTILPDPMPPNIGSAVEWWVKTMQAPQGRHEAPHHAPVVGGRGSRWEYAYQTRVVDNLRRFLRLPRKDRDMIVAAREDGVYWRGESIQQLIAITGEHAKMRQVGGKEYAKAIAPGLAKMRRKARAAA